VTIKKRARISTENLTPEERAEAQAAFLAAYGRAGNVTAGCEAAGVSRTSLYRWLEHDETFAFRYEQAKARYCDKLRQEIDRRAVTGVLKPVYYQGERVGSVREYSDILLIFQAKAKMPEYRDKVQIEQASGVGIGALALLRAVIEQVFPDDPDAVERLADALAASEGRRTWQAGQ